MRRHLLVLANVCVGRENTVSRLRAFFWRCVEMLQTPRARLAPFLKRRRHRATWLKAGLSARVKHLRGEEQLRHATIVSIEPRGLT